MSRWCITTFHGGNHTNAGLAGEAARKQVIVDRNAGRKTHRFQQRQRIQYVLDRVPQASEALKTFGACDAELLRDIAELPAELARYEQVF